MQNEVLPGIRHRLLDSADCKLRRFLELKYHRTDHHMRQLERPLLEHPCRTSEEAEDEQWEEDCH